MTSRLPSPLSAEQLHKRVAAGTRAVLLAQVASQLFAVAVLAGMWRMVGPAEYGLLGMVMPWIMFIRMAAGAGLGVAAIQQQQLKDPQLSALFWWQIALGLIAGAVTAAAAPLLAWLYGDAKTLTVTLALAGIAPIMAAGVLHDALLQRKLLIGQLMVIRFVAQVVGACAGLVAAFADFGVWALVAQQYGEMAALTTGLWLREAWRPVRISQTASIAPLLRFGGYYTLSGLLFYVAQNADKVLLALLLGSSEAGRTVVGLYTQAFGLMTKPVALVTSPLAGLMLPALAAATSDRWQFENIAVRFYRLVAIALWPCALGLFVVAPLLTMSLGGEAWHSAGQVLRILALAICAQGAINIAGSVLAAAGRADSLLGGAFVMLLVLLQAYLAGYFLADFFAPSDALMRGQGVAVGFTFGTAGILFVPYLIYVCATTGISARRLLAATFKPAIAAIIMAVGVAALQHYLAAETSLPPIALLATSVGVGVVLYVVLARHEVKWLWRELRS